LGAGIEERGDEETKREEIAEPRVKWRLETEDWRLETGDWIRREGRGEDKALAYRQCR
jgi:hypothetical protein